MKITNNFRKCEYCPHKQHRKKCCCRGRAESIPHSHKHPINLSRSRPNKYDGNISAFSRIGNSIKMANHSDEKTGIIVENSVLRTENDYLKRQLQLQCHYSNNESSHRGYKCQQFNPMPTKDDHNVTTLPTSENQSSSSSRLHHKLYQSNRKLQQALLEMDSLSKSNKKLHELNTKLEMDFEKMRIHNQQLNQEITKLRRKVKKLNRVIDSLPAEQEIRCLLNDKIVVENQNRALVQQIEQLNLRVNQHRNSRADANLSPEWVAQTSTKINAIERNISKLELENKQNQNANGDQCVHACLKSSNSEQTLIFIKNQLVSTLKSLYTQSETLIFTQFPELDQRATSVTPQQIISLFIKVLQMSVMPFVSHFNMFQKEVDRTMKYQQLRFERFVKRMENLIIKLNNEKLRAKSRSKRV